MISRPLLPRAAFLRGGRQPLAVPAGGPLCSHRPKEGCHRRCCCPVGSTAARSSSARSPAAATRVPPPPRGFPTPPPPQPEPPQRAASPAPAPALACCGPSEKSGAPPDALGESLRRRRPERGVPLGPGGSTLELPGGLRLSSVRDLLARNGFEAVEVSERPLYLSEGVVAKADRASSSSWRGVAAFRPERHASGSREHLFARPAKHLRKQRRQDRHPETPPLPAFVGEDMALYRFAETHAAAFLDRRRAAWTRWVRARVLPPLKNLREKASSARASATRVRDTFGDALERSLLERFLEAVLGDRCEKRGGGDTKRKAGSSRTSKDAIMKDAGHVDGLDRSSSVDSQKDSPHTTEKPIDETTERILGDKPKEVSADDVDEDGDEDDALEDLVVIVSVPQGKTKQTGAFSAVSRSGPGSSSSNSHHQTNNNDDPGDELLVSVALYGAMTPSTRVLATRRFSLGHSAASTLVSVSLVVSGALPMAHRSYAFCSEYPWLVDPSLVGATLVATVGYTLWAARWRARTARASSVASALCARVCARERAVLLALEEGAAKAGQPTNRSDPPKRRTPCLASEPVVPPPKRTNQPTN